MKQLKSVHIISEEDKKRIDVMMEKKEPKINSILSILLIVGAMGAGLFLIYLFPSTSFLKDIFCGIIWILLFEAIALLKKGKKVLDILSLRDQLKDNLITLLRSRISFLEKKIHFKDTEDAEDNKRLLY